MGAGRQRGNDAAPGDAAAPFGEARVAIHRQQQDAQPFAIAVLAKIVAAGLRDGEVMGLVGRIAKARRRREALVHDYHRRRLWQARTRWRSSSARSSAVTTGVSAGRWSRSACSFTRLMTGVGALSQSNQRP
ncbi:hypothetical protein CP98_02840 [Sphingobium yanoikuyae]|uniref:Uncharacterized protein n=1 Tax=Sphingobium yanoikuyae TaxID=13690 RepID=A0A084EJZ4_SPHYA|nr:hypothetical protein CP98_02840 [Sphingobium yanoikuyae]